MKQEVFKVTESCFITEKANLCFLFFLFFPKTLEKLSYLLYLYLSFFLKKLPRFLKIYRLWIKMSKYINLYKLMCPSFHSQKFDSAGLTGSVSVHSEQKYIFCNIKIQWCWEHSATKSSHGLGTDSPSLQYSVSDHSKLQQY